MSEGNVEPTTHPTTSTGKRPSYLRRMLGESAVYGLGGVANQALGIILVPIYARQLGVTDYGTVAILSTTLSLTTMIATLAMPQAFFRSYLKEADTESERAAVLRTTIGLRLIVSILALLLISGFAYPLAVVLLGTGAEWHLMALIGAIVFFDSLNVVPFSFLRAERRPFPYVRLAFIRAVLGSALIIVFVVVFDLGVVGVLLGSLASAIVTASVALLTLAREHRLGLGFDRPLVRHMLAFALPLVPASIAGWTLNLSDRYIVQAFDGRTAVGLYSSGYTVGLAINALAIAPFGLAWGATYWEIARQPDARETIARTLTAFVTLAAFAALGLSAMSTDLFRFFLTPEFEAGRFVTPFSAFGYVFYGVYTVVTTGLNLESQTRRVPLILGGVAIANVAINLALVPFIGYLGAAISTLVSYAMLAVIGGVVSQRYYAVQWQLGRPTALITLALALSAAALLGPDHVAWRAACVIAYPGIGLGLRLIPIRTLTTLVSIVRRR